MSRLRELVRRLLATPGTRRIIGGISLATASLLCSIARASGTGGHGEPHINWWGYSQDEPPVGWFILDFIIFCWLLVKFVGPPFKKMLLERHHSVKKAIEENAASHAKALAHHDEYRDKLSMVQEEIRSLVEDAREDGASERDRIVEAATKYAEGLRQDVKGTIDQEVGAAQARLRTDTADTVLQKANSLLQKTINADDKKRLLNVAIVDLEESAERASGSTRRAAS